jgi:hypothetical protein
VIDDLQSDGGLDSHLETFAGLRTILRPLFHPKRADVADQAITDLLLALCSVPYERAPRGSYERRTGARSSSEPRDFSNAASVCAEAL